MWPLDVSLLALSGLVLYLVVTQLRFDDPRWLFNGWTYAVAIPLTAGVLALILHAVASKFVRKSVQFGFLFSCLVHLLLLILAINVVIFTTYLPTATGEKPRRSPIRRTVPEYVFQSPQDTPQRPDWSRPVETETASRVQPLEQQRLPPVQRSEPRLEMPRPQEQPQRQLQKFMIQRQEPAESQPMPAESPGRLARRQIRQPEPKPSTNPIETPSVETSRAARPDVMRTERQLADVRSRPSTSRRAPEQRNVMTLAPAQQQQLPENLAPRAALRNPSQAMPTVGDAGLARQQRQPARASRMQPAGASPAPPTVAVAQLDASASRMLSPVQTPATRSGQARGAQITGQTSSQATQMSQQSSPGGAELARSQFAARAGVPDVQAGPSARAPGRARQANATSGFAPVGAPNPSDTMAAASAGTDGSGPSDEVQDRMGFSDFPTERAERPGGGADSTSLANAGAPGLALDIMANDGPVGFADRATTNPGVMPLADQPQVASLDFATNARPRRDVGGPATPVGTKVAAVESFSRRVMRTSGTAAPAPAGMAGPATEEAIERGLAYLASVQNKDGSWSLQGHGEEVLLRSDSAATGLCLLAFQGAGYTHLQHQYADTVAKGIQFLIDNQKSNGDLYRSENEISNQNVALYSHGIAALAVSEAYGMTQDAGLREPAQMALDYIAATQHRQRGGWRYTPQISADTSVSGWMMMALKSGELSGLEVQDKTYRGIDRWLELSQQSPDRPDRYRYNPFAPDTETQRHGRLPTPTMTAVGMLMRMYSGWRRDNEAMRSAADYLLQYPPALGSKRAPKRDGYYWYYATQVMFHMGGDHWEQWNQHLNPLLLRSQLKSGPNSGSWDPELPVRDRWSPHAGRLYVTTMNLLNLEVYYRHLPIYEDTAD